MIRETFAFSGLLIILGLVGYFATGMVSITALIPVFLGIILLVCVMLALNENLNKHAMHSAVLFSLFGFLGSVRGIYGVIQMISKLEVQNPAAQICRTIMALLCLAYLILSIRWFLKNRKTQSPRMIGR